MYGLDLRKLEITNPHRRSRMLQLQPCGPLSHISNVVPCLTCSGFNSCDLFCNNERCGSGSWMTLGSRFVLQVGSCSDTSSMSLGRSF